MNYAKQLREYKNKPNVKSLTKEIVKFSNPGEFILGKITKVEPFKSNKFDHECNRYEMDTITGIKSFILGERLDGELEGVNLIGRTLCVQFKGKIDLDNQKTCNLFDVMDLTDVDISKIVQDLDEE